MANNLLVEGRVVQGTAPSTVPIKIYSEKAYQGTSSACVVDLTPPVFAGIDSVITGSLGQIRATWSLATDITNPIRYEIYILPNTNAGLFNAANITAITDKLQCDIFTLPNGQLLQNGIVYHIGVRAVDAVGNRELNTVSLSISTLGITSSVNTYDIEGVFAINEINQLIASFWITEDEVLITPPTRLGTASYIIYDKNGNVVPGMSQSGIVADSNGLFEITPVTSSLAYDLTYYTVKVVVVIDGVNKSSFLPIAGSSAVYEPRGGFSINASNQLQGTFWIVKNGEHLVDNLGTATYTIYDKDSNSIGITEASIVADSEGFYKITPVLASAILDLTHYVVKIQITANGKAHNGVLFIGVAE